MFEEVKAAGSDSNAKNIFEQVFGQLYNRDSENGMTSMHPNAMEERAYGKYTIIYSMDTLKLLKWEIIMAK